MATTRSSHSHYLLLEAEGREVLRLPLFDGDSWREGLSVCTRGCVAENEEYDFVLVSTTPVAASSVTVSVNGEVVGRGGRPLGDGEEGNKFTSIHREVDRPFRLITGYARAEVSFVAGGSTQHAFTEDVPVLTKGNPQAEAQRVSGMFSDLFEGESDEALMWMLIGTPSEGRRFSIVEGSLFSRAPRGLSTFLQMSDHVLAAFADLLPFLRQHAVSRVGSERRRIARDKVTRLGVNEAMWVARNPDSLERVSGTTGISDGRRSFLPRYIESEQRTRTFDTYENQVIVAFLHHLARQFDRLSSLLESHGEHDRAVLDALSPYTRDGYFLSSLLVTSASSERRRRVRRTLEGLSEKAFDLSRECLLAFPGCSVLAFRPPRRSKIFQEVHPYTRLYELMQQWCRFGDVDLSPEGLALRVERMDALYEYYVLHRLLVALRDLGFSPDEDEATPIANFSGGQGGAYDAPQRQVANTYLLRNGDVRVRLYYQPVFGAHQSDRGGLALHRTTSSIGGRLSPYTPDYLIRMDKGDGRWIDVVLDAKYRYVAGVTGHADKRVPLASGEVMWLTELQNCLRKYKLECVATDTGEAPRSVWLLCGRESVRTVSQLEAAVWAPTGASALVPSGAASVSPDADATREVLDAVGLTNLAKRAEAAPLLPKLEIEPADEGSGETAALDTKSDHDMDASADKPAEAEDGQGPDETTPAVIRTDKASDEARAGERAKLASARARSQNRGRGADEQVLAAIRKLMASLPRGGEQLYDARWVLYELGINAPLLRKSLPSGRDARKYRRMPDSEEGIFFLATMLPPDRAKLLRYVQTHSE